jgi:hypothetical protein
MGDRAQELYDTELELLPFLKASTDSLPQDVWEGFGAKFANQKKTGFVMRPTRQAGEMPQSYDFVRLSTILPSPSDMKVVPAQPITAIPEFFVMQLSQQAYHTAAKIVAAASKIQPERLNPSGRPYLRWRIEIAAAFLEFLIDHAQKTPEVKADLKAITEEQSTD